MDSTALAAIVGLCPDMCPEPERAERERKGDLDRYERLDGDRNLTTELLAVKKVHTTFLVSWQYDSISFELFLITDNKKFDGIHYVIVTV
uniref:SAC3/GANP/THP3 conserved domain-containing protein n=1 Tax=Zea mays TaxID=4577 RepID=A0A804QHW2_MAIZE